MCMRRVHDETGPSGDLVGARGASLLVLSILQLVITYLDSPLVLLSCTPTNSLTPHSSRSRSPPKYVLVFGTNPNRLLGMYQSCPPSPPVPTWTSQVASSADWKVEHRVLSLVKMGFKRKEAEAALSSSPSGEVMGHDTLTLLLEPLRSQAAASSSSGSGGSVEWSSSTRTEEVCAYVCSRTICFRVGDSGPRSCEIVCNGAMCMNMRTVHTYMAFLSPFFWLQFLSDALL